MEVYPQAESIVSNHPKPQDVLIGAVKQSDVPLQLQKLTCTVMAVCHGDKSLSNLYSYLVSHLEGTSPPSIDVDDKVVVEILQDFATLSNDMDALEETFLATRFENAVQLNKVPQTRCLKA